MNRPSGAGDCSPAAHPPLPLADEDWTWVRDRCAALGLADPNPWRPVFEALYGHLLGVNAWMNLTRLTDGHAYCHGHLLDSLACLLAPSCAGLAPGGLCVDLGSGCGYPGLPLMTLRPDLRWVLIDSRRRKVAFLAQAITLTPAAASAEARHLRGAESATAAADIHGTCALVVARAVGPAERVIAEAAGFLAPGGHLVLAKGQAYQGTEHGAALVAAADHGLVHQETTAYRLADDDPPRLLVAFCRRG